MDQGTIIGIVVFFLMLGMVFTGIPVFLSMLVAAFGGFIALSGGDLTLMLTKFTTGPFSLGANYNYAVLPMFMLVGTLASETGIAESAFASMKTWFSRVKGGLLFTIVASNAVFGACSGSSIAGNIVFGKLAIPELTKEGYSRKYSMGCIAAAGALSTLIPPSMGIIMFCLIAPVSLSVGTALMGGVIPGIVTALSLCVTVRLIGRFVPGSIPPAGTVRIPVSVKLKSLKLLLPIFMLFGIIIGGTFAGFFTATVGGAIGAVAVCVYALVKRIPLKKLGLSIWDAAVMEAGIFPIIVGGQIFGSFIAATGLADTLARGIAGINAPPFAVFMVVVLFYILCGCVMDIVSIIIITVPIVFPILTGLGYSPYVLIITLCFMCEIAGLTPPVGMNVFATANALRVNPSEIFRGVVPYFFCELIMVIIIALFPQLVLWLPTLLNAVGA
jgi:tripartite ATP-independent transporter DctM subunit